MKVKDHSVSGELFSLEYDAHKHMYFTTPRPSKEDLPSYYQSEDYISHTDSRRSLFERIYQFVKGITLSRKQKLLQSYVPNKGSVLDIGAGTGDFLAYLKKHEWDVAGIEPNEQARKLAYNKNISLSPSLDEITDRYDVITMWHVLEHVYDLEQQIVWLKEHLKPKGVLCVAVPNFESWDAKKYGEFWAAYDVPRHLYHFSQKSIQNLFEESDFEIIGKHPMKFDAYYVSLLSEKYKTGKLNFLKPIYVGWRSNRSAKRTGNYSSLIYVLTHKTL